MKRVVVLISGSGSNLQALIDATQRPECPFEIVSVLSNVPGVKGLERATESGIPIQVIEHTAYASRRAFDDALRERIDKLAPDLVVLAGFMRILTPEFVHHFAKRLINIHPSLLPKFPGTNTHQRALESTEKWHGASVHFVIPEVDAGPIIIQGRLLVSDTNDARQLAARVLKIEHIIYPQAVWWFAQGRLSINEDKVLLDGEISPEQLQTFEA